MTRSQLPRYVLSALACAALMVIIGELAVHLRALRDLVPPGWDASGCGADSDLGVWGGCGPIQAARFATNALLVTCVTTAVWGGVTFFDPARASRPGRTFLLGAGASALAYLAWAMLVGVPAIALHARAAQAFWMLPQPATGASPTPFLTAWPASLPMGVATICLLVRGGLGLRDALRGPAATRSLADDDSPPAS